MELQCVHSTIVNVPEREGDGLTSPQRKRLSIALQQLEGPRFRRAHALVTCYGPLPIEAKRLASLNASVFGIFAGKDKSIPPEAIAHFTTAMDKAGKRLFPLRVYGDCAHGFLDPAYWPIYGQPAEKDVDEAWDLIARYLNRTLM